ncbi:MULTISPECIES: hypothetical protein [unclassified Thiocapsa]|uniref:hypothetical protein n=1 Tax=unclassified Thiocapsa TaxID=2641286 RepID=UPI0035AFAAB1
MPDASSTTQEQPVTPVFILPGALFATFPDRPAILRTCDPAEPRALFGSETPENLAFIQLTGLAGDLTPLADWGDGVPLDLLMGDPVVELPLLYRCTGLSVRHPVRVTVPYRPGLARAVKLALSLGFSVRLHGHQPSPEAVAEARQALAEYLHNPTVSQPVEPFHTLLIAFLQDTPVALWSLLERDPAEVRVLDERGEQAPGQGPDSVAAFRDALLAAGGECCGCPYLSRCDGYFKWPRSDYSCIGVKRLFAEVETAADALRADLAAHTTPED